MIKEALAQIDLKRYHEVAAHLLPEPTSLLFYCGDEVILMTGPENGASDLVDWLNAHHPNWAQQDAPQRYESGDRVVGVFGFRVHAGTVVAQFIVSHGRVDDAIAVDAIEVLGPLFDCMQTELRLADELIVMADELTARYEELNLVYDTQDQASDYEETQNQLKALVVNCRDYLNVSFSGLMLREKDLTLYDVDPDTEASEVLVALDILKGQMYDWVTASKQIAVVNDVDDKLGSVLCAGVPYKLIAVPVFSGTGEVCGLLIIARTYAQPNFTNNDKNLLDVMSRKASKIIQASYDAQTGLMKRSGFEYLVTRALQSTKLVGMAHAVFVIDIDRMQVTNDTLGYEAGDMVITEIAQVIQDNLRAGDTVARLGGDEFGVLISNCDTDVAKRIGLKICEAIEHLKLSWQGKNIDASVSIGVTPVTPESKDVGRVIAAAEVACSSVKEEGGNSLSLYQSGDEELVRRRSYMDLVGRIQDTLRADRFELFCQPIVPLQAGVEELHAEVLLRMRDESGEIIAPGLFLPAAERYHLMPAIDRWVVGKTIEMLETSMIYSWRSDVLISINLSGQTLTDQAFVAYIHEILDASVIPSNKLCFEITETTAIADVTLAQQFIAAFQERGVLFSLDDFGTGLSTFSYLRQLPVNYLKIDGSFVKEICTDPIAETMVSAINQVGHTMNLLTIGEFVENEAIQTRLTELGVDFGQGYGIAKPGPLSEYLAGITVPQQVRDAG